MHENQYFLKLMKLLVYDLHHKMTSPCFLLLQPGRVATLIEDHEAVTYGVAFQLINEAALDYLNNREVALGGYISHITMFIPQDPTRMPMPVLLYVATPSNQHWLGHASSEHIANQVRLLCCQFYFRHTCYTSNTCFEVSGGKWQRIIPLIGNDVTFLIA